MTQATQRCEPHFDFFGQSNMYQGWRDHNLGPSGHMSGSSAWTLLGEPNSSFASRSPVIPLVQLILVYNGDVLAPVSIQL